MKFRFVLLPDDDRDGHPPVRKEAAAVDHSTSRILWYEQRGSEMVRVEQLPSGARKCTSIANFTARIVTDMIRDDGDEQRRDFRVEAEVGKSALAALCQQHFGATMNGGSLPANFVSTGNALEWLAFYAKDALVVTTLHRAEGEPMRSCRM